MPAGSFGNTRSDVIVARGEGSHVWDENGKEFIDYLLGSGPMFVGHRHPKVNAAIQDQLQRGTTFFANNPQGIKLAETIVDAVACADQVRYTSTGTEADVYAMRLVRAYRGRDKILKFEGGYHGMSDASLMSLAPKNPGNTLEPIPDSSGIPTSVRNDVLIAPYNDIDTVAQIVREHADEIAGVIVEPMQRIINPKPGFHQDLRDLTLKHDIPLIFDEVVTGFRLAYGGAQEHFGITPDLCTLGKVIGGGFPLAAVAGKEEIMAHFDATKVKPEEFVVQIGTLSGNPMAAAAGLATMEVLREPGKYEHMERIGTRLMSNLQELLNKNGFEATVSGVPSMFEVVFAAGPIENYRDTLRGDTRLSGRLNALLRERGILKSDNKYYVSMAHTDADVDATIAAWSESLAVMAAER
jgi:glutamate-1-semialdehyde 2,1-aminomutase